MKDMTLFDLQIQVNLGWTMDTYSDAFKAVPLAHRDFQHALHHLMKPLGKLSAMVEDADHVPGPIPPCFPIEDVEKYLADLVISALRMASMNPSGTVNLQRAVLARIEEKMGLKLTPTVKTPPGPASGATKRYAICRLFGNVSEWLAEADTREEAEAKFEIHKPSVKPGETLIIGETATGRWMKKWPEA